VPEWRALAALYAKKLCTMSELADLATIDRTTLTRTIDRMQDAGWLQRLADDADMRVTRLSLTAAGRRMFDRIWPAVERLNALALEGLSKAEIRALQGVLSRMHANLEDYVDEGEPHAS
jgi:MarR family transcriptional regulator, organic hydroperoxide resistance regulator